MRKIIAFILGLTIAGAAYASCTTHTYLLGGRMVICTTCCTPYGYCTTSCL